ncbi:isochorismatase family cysteine hydrolase [Nocardia crassostreae]|uniref:isochorismatase family cysteine hydrolase n=1 Tax=Nocardia crassostreae TaxID=53428 RepID=UPI00082DF9D8|nr:isochorismatase family cysteine hydrolase [Nocardia crassostreae]
MSKIAVLTSGLQYDIVGKNPERQAAIAAATPHVTEFLSAMRKRGHPVFQLQLLNEPDDPLAERYDGRVPAVRGTAGAEVVREFLDDEDIVQERSKDSGFYETDLHARLQALGVETLILIGLQTQICIQTTAADAFFRGYIVGVPSDCVFSAQEADRRRALEWLEGYCATVADSTEILRTLDENGGLPRKETKTP